MCSVLMKFKKISQKGIKSEKRLRRKTRMFLKRKEMEKKSQKHLQKEKIE